ncbi:hypothetical protein RI129_005490 [Pyrocoelia pectoralis]|uniref:Queuosine 5'-phosphate N-glycosylase/hydrolase n=1 Tax=Pyrocoelia pectoralis TaxID=417401 RepID=A0AAN7VKY6_9COLE
MVLSPRESGKLITKLAKYVQIESEGIKFLGDLIVKDINSGKLSIETFSQHSVHPKPTDPWALDWIFVVDTLNFCFWHKENEQGWVVDGKSGYFALCTAINRAVKENVDILNPKFYSTITREQLAKVLRSDNSTEIPLLNERVISLHEVGASLLETFQGSFKNCVLQAKNSSTSLLKIITDNFKCYRDEAVYKGHEVSFYKRAQILVADIWACYKNKGLGNFNDIGEMTMFADYRVPQSLLYYNVLNYSGDLINVLNDESILENGNEMEVEIRGCSIEAVNLLCNYIEQRIDSNKKVNAILIDHFLWDFRRSHAKEIVQKKLPFHKTFCIYY